MATEKKNAIRDSLFQIEVTCHGTARHHKNAKHGGRSTNKNNKNVTKSAKKKKKKSTEIIGLLFSTHISTKANEGRGAIGQKA